MKEPMYRIPIIKMTMTRQGEIEAPAVATGSAVANLVRRYLGVDVDREYCVVICLDCRNRLTCIETVAIGTLTQCPVHPREVFKAAINSNAVSIIFAHNHPTGDCTPSPEDKSTTKKLAEAGRILSIPLLDHVVVADNGYFSFFDNGMLSHEEK